MAAICFLLFLPLAVNADAARQNESPAEAILRRSINAARKVNFAGTETVTVPTPSGMHSMTREVMRSKEGVTLTRWTDPPSQRGLTILDDGKMSRAYHPGERLVRISRSTPRARNEKSAARLMRLILRNYKVSFSDPKRPIAPMAGRSCYKIRLTPIYRMSHMVEMWIDRETGAVLSHAEFARNGATVTLATFGGVKFPRLNVTEMRRSIPANAKTETFTRSNILRNFAEVRKLAGFEFCPPYSMPGGYEFEHAEILSLKGNTTTCLRYTDGIAEITICQNRSAEQRPAEYRATHPMVDGMGNNIVDHQVGQMNFYLVGRCEMSGLLAVIDALNAEREREWLAYFSRVYHLPAGTLAGLRNQGLGLDTLDALLAINLQTRKPLDALVGLCRDGYGWAAIARRFRADLDRIVKHVRSFQAR